MEWYLKVIRNYADFSGRARRKEFWMFVLFNLLFAFLAAIIDATIGTYNSTTGVGLFGTIYSLFVLIPGLAVSVRRLHDTNRSGWWLLIALIPVIGAIWLLVLYVLEGDYGENKYGPDPKSHGGQSPLEEDFV